MMKIFLVFASILTATLLVTIYSGDNWIDQLQALAQTNDMEVNNTNSPASSEKMSIVSAASPGQTIFYRGIEASKEPVHLNFPQ